VTPAPASGWAWPLVLGLFEKRFDGDDALLDLARLRFAEAGLGAEIHAATPRQLRWLLGFVPPDVPATVHLPRGLNVLDTASRAAIADIAGASRGRLAGMIVHDQVDATTRPGDYVAALADLDGALQAIDEAPPLFVEYAVGLEPAQYVELFGRVRELSHVSACVDVGHVGLRAAFAAYARRHDGESLGVARTMAPDAGGVLPGVREAVEAALPAVLALVEALARFAKRLHFHLHDGHPLAVTAPYGLSDHLGFFDAVGVGTHGGVPAHMAPMFGAAGLEAIVRTALSALPADRLSFTLEIHPSDGRLPVGDAAALFRHWTDLDHAERTNHWLSLLVRHATLVRQACEGTHSSTR
jgi:hypothetical protein